MRDFVQPWAPNLADYWKQFIDALRATGGIAFVIGFVIGIVLTVTKPGGIKENKIVYTVTNLFTNVFRSIPFLILLIFLIPFTRSIVGTAIGVKGAIIPLVFGFVSYLLYQKYYKLDEKTYEDICRQLEERNEGEK